MTLSNKYTTIIIIGTKPGATTTQRPERISFNDTVQQWFGKTKQLTKPVALCTGTEIVLLSHTEQP